VPISNIRKSTHENISIIELEGEIDARTAPEFEQAITSEIESGKFYIAVGCEKLNYISSAGLGVFMSFVEEIRELGGDIKIYGMQEEIKEIVDTLGFSDIYDILDNLPKAIESFNQLTARKA
jgi:anti-sigma B factor antagonist